jgi:hypothetical protein
VNILDQLAGRDDIRRRPKPRAVAEGGPSIAASRAPREAANPTPVKPTRIDPWRPFPTNEFPEPARTYVVEAARAIGCDPVFVGLPLLVTMAAAVGLSHVLRIKRDWFARSILWGAVIGRSGSTKTPALDAALRFIRDRQTEARRRHIEALTQWTRDDAAFEKELKRWENGDQQDELPTRPPKPVMERTLATNTTIEALAVLLEGARKGLLIGVDELAGFVNGFDRYSNGKGSDAANWLSTYSAGPIIMDRKTGDQKSLFVPHAAVSIIGGVQPGVWARLMTREHRDAGLDARFLVAFPPTEASRWTDDDVADETVERMAAAFTALFDLEQARDPNGEPTPHIVTMTAEARREWIEFYNEHNRSIAETDSEDLRASLKKIEEVAPRIALGFHVLRAVTDGTGRTERLELGAESMLSGIELARWFAHESKRVRSILAGETDTTAKRRKLIDWITARGREVTARDVYTGLRGFDNSDVAEAALNELCLEGLGYWRNAPTGPRGGRPGRVFVLSTEGVSAQHPISWEKQGSADADTADGFAESPEERVATDAKGGSSCSF